MVARRDIRQRLIRELLFEVGIVTEGAVCRPPHPRQRGTFKPSDNAVLDVAQITTMNGTDPVDDIHIVPGRFVVKAKALEQFMKRLPKTARVTGDPLKFSDDLVIVSIEFERLEDDSQSAANTRGSLELIRTTSTTDEGTTQFFAPMYGFICHQTSHPVDDPELVNAGGSNFALARARAQVGSSAGTGVRIVVIDTGRRRADVKKSSKDEIDYLRANTPAAATKTSNSPYLGRAAGHGTFIAGLLTQVVPGAEVIVLRALSTDGIVDELRFATKISEAAKLQPDLVLICCGGTMYRLGNNQQWLHPLLLKAAITDLLKTTKTKGTVVVMSAGNDGSGDHNYPAAFADPAQPLANVGGRLVSVAALDNDNWRAYFSNYGPWVTASALGVRLESNYVNGDEAPDNDPDGSPESWNEKDPWAVWSGTSFAAPLVAGMIARTQWARRQKTPNATATDAWQVLRSISAPGPSPSCGVVIAAPMVAHA